MSGQCMSTEMVQMNPPVDRAGAAARLAQLDLQHVGPGFYVWRRRLVLERDCRKCYLCGRELGLYSGTVDHVTPLSRGGADQPSNWRAACLKCNRAKGRLTLAEYLERHAGAEVR